MRLSRKNAIELCVELWTWLAKTGRRKEKWPGWEKYGHDIVDNCWFCEYHNQQMKRYKPMRERNKDGFCRYCPLVKGGFMSCYDSGCFYSNWCTSTTVAARKTCAKLFLKQIKEACVC